MNPTSLQALIESLMIILNLIARHPLQAVARSP